MTGKTALVAGATGATAKRLIEVLLAQDWQVIGVSRHATETSNVSRLSYIRADLLDPASCAPALKKANGITHLFYTARAAFGEGGVESVELNVAMLRNVLNAVDAAAPRLEHVHLVEGQKWYDVRVRPARTPTREDDPRPPQANFYYDQEDLLRERQAKRDWTWSASRPHMVYDFAPERPRNVVPTIGAWAAMCAELGMPLDFPGSPGCFSALMEFTDATQLARAMVWMATSETARNQAYNVTDSCQFRWQWLWPRIAAHFSLQPGQVRPLKLTEWMQDKEPAWERIVKRHGLAQTALKDVASWAFADFLWGLDSDLPTDTTKIRLHGFHGVVDTTDQFLVHLRRYREARLLP
ncbi:MAG: SDR family oxidoreductase [Betaproteobacteria bacterium]|nr:SDR family oxidoreductase [Betaproteobacteria bacterium]